MFRLTIMNEARARLYFHPNHYRQPDDRPRVAYRDRVIEAKAARGSDWGEGWLRDCLRDVRHARRRI